MWRVLDRKLAAIPLPLCVQEVKIRLKLKYTRLVLVLISGLIMSLFNAFQFYCLSLVNVFEFRLVLILTKCINVSGVDCMVSTTTDRTKCINGQICQRLQPQPLPNAHKGLI